MKKTEGIQKELKEVAPFLAGLKKENSFKVPENYFDQLQEQVMDQILAENNKTRQPEQRRVISIFRHRVFQFAAAITLLFVVAFLINQDGKSPLSIAEITPEEAAFYLAQNLENLDDELLYDLDPDDLGSSSEIRGLNEELLDEILEDYLNEMDDQILENLL